MIYQQNPKAEEWTSSNLVSISCLGLHHKHQSALVSQQKLTYTALPMMVATTNAATFPLTSLSMYFLSCSNCLIDNCNSTGKWLIQSIINQLQEPFQPTKTKSVQQNRTWLLHLPKAGHTSVIFFHKQEGIGWLLNCSLYNYRVVKGGGVQGEGFP